MNVLELKGKSHVFALKDGTTLRIFAHQKKKIEDNNISDELEIAESMGLVSFIKESTEVPKNKKSGGTK